MRVGRRKKKVIKALEASEAQEEALLVEERDTEKAGDRFRNPILDLLVRKIGTYQLLRKDTLMESFRQVDDYYADAIQYLSEHTTFLEAVVADNLAEVLGGITSGRIIHNLPTFKNKDLVWTNHVDFISQGLETIAKRLSGKKQDFPKDIAKLRLVGSTIFNALEFYVHQGSEYIALSEKLALYLIKHPSNLSGKKKHVEHLKKKMAAIASTIGTAESDVPIITRYLENVVSKVRDIHNFIFNHHLRLLIKVATSHKTDNDQLLDNFQSGSFGLMRAVKDYVPPYNFIGYASSWIRQAVLGSMRLHSNNIRIPGNVLQEYSALEKVRNSLKGDPSIDEIADKACQDPKKVQRIYDLVQLAHTYSLHREVNNAETSNSSKDGAPTTLMDIIPDDKQHPDEQEDMTEKVKKYLDLLTPQQRWVVCLYFGLLDYLPEVRTPTYQNSCKELQSKFESFEKERLRQLLITAHLRMRKRNASLH